MNSTHLLLLSFVFLFACKTSIDTENRLPAQLQGLKKMQLISGGFFRRGSEQGAAAEKPVQTIALNSFYIDITPITYREYEQYVKAGGSINADWADNNYHRLDMPVTGLTWFQAVDFCNWRSSLEGLQAAYRLTTTYDDYGYPIWEVVPEADGYRLPTEAEFEYVAGCGETQQTFPWGEEFDGQYANFDIERKSSVGNKWRRLAPITELHQNKWGVAGMSGNHWHWCEDWFDTNYYAESPKENPKGAAIGTGKAIRGGSWGSPSPEFLKIYKRSYAAPSNHNFDIGFRCVKPIVKNNHLLTKNPQKHQFYRTELYCKPKKFEGNVYSEEFVGLLGKYIADYYPNCLYFYCQVDKQEVLTPHSLAKLIVEITKEYNIHPLMLTGIFAAESGFASCSVPRWYNNPLAFHWQNKLIANGEPEYNAPIGLKNEKFATLRDNFRAFCKGIRKRFYIPSARGSLADFHRLYVGYDDDSWMLPVCRTYRDVLGVQISAKTPTKNIGRYIYTDWEEFQLLLP